MRWVGASVAAFFVETVLVIAAQYPSRYPV